MGRTIALKKKHFEIRLYAIIFLVIFALIFVRYCYYGMKYYYQLDDYIQYHNYEAAGKSLLYLIEKLGLLSSRPLAGICDILIWSRFYGTMIVAVAVISAMYAASSVLFHQVFSRHFGTGYLFFVVYALLPMGFEGTYWVSASSRIVVGLFFASLSLLNFDNWCTEGKRLNLVLFSVFQFISFCFYEQVVLLSGAATLIIMLLSIKKQNKHRPIWGLMMLVSAALYVVITKLAPSGTYGGRTALFLPWKENYSDMIFVPLIRQMKEAFIYGSGAICGKGFVRGLKLIGENPNYLYMLIVPMAATVLFFAAKKSGRCNIRFFAELFSGIFLALAPIAIFFIIKNPWFGLRNTVTSYCGIALVLDAMADLIFGRFKRGYIAEAAIASVLAVLCCISSVSELHDYRETTLSDTKIASAAASVENSPDIKDSADIWLMNVDASYISDGNFYFHEHDYGVTSSSWAISGAISAIGGKSSFPNIDTFIPISSKTAFTAEKGTVGKSPAYWYTGDRFIPVSIVNSDGSSWKVMSKSGTQLGMLRYSDGTIILST